MKRITINNVVISFLLVLIITTACVESLTDNQQSSNATPSIVIDNPASGDSVSVGKNIVAYQATDGTGGSGLSFYEVYLNEKYVQRFEQNTDGTNPEIYLNIDSKLIGTKIKYMIKVYNKLNKSKESGLQENIFVRDSVPGAPTNLMLSKLNDFAVNLLWNADNVNNETGFELWRKVGGSGTYQRIKNMPPNTISTDDSGLSAFTDYFYKVRAINSSGASEFSNEVSTSSISGGPWNLKAEAIGSSTVRLTWDDFAVNELGFIIERTDPYTSNFQRVDLAPRGATEYYDNTVSASTGYRYRVAYYTSTSVSGYSNEASISTYYTDVEGPSNLSVTYDFQNQVVILNWLDNTLLEKETIIERKIEGGNYIEYATLSENDEASITAMDAGIQKGQTYFYRIRQSLGSKIYTPYSNEVKIVIPN